MSFAGSLIDELTAAYEKTPWDQGVFDALYDAWLATGEQPPVEMRRQRLRQAAPNLEHEWKRDRNHAVYEELSALYRSFDLDPQVEFDRLVAEVELDVERQIYEELSGEHGNFEQKPWKVYVLSEERPYQSTQFVKVPFRNELGELLIADVAVRPPADPDNPVPVSHGAVEIYEIRRENRQYVPRAEAGDFDEAMVLRAAQERATPWEKPAIVLPDGTELWRQRNYDTKEFDPYERHFVLDGAPEWLQSELEHEYERDDGLEPEFVTVYGAGGEYLQDAKDPKEIWQLVRENGLGEHECPLRHFDPETREEHYGSGPRLVTESDTYFGKEPGKRCILCDEAIGEEHGYIYLGEEPAEFVYMKVVRALSSQIDTREIEAQVREAFRTSGLLPDDTDFETFFEHGQWWVRYDEWEDEPVEHTYSVVDTDDGFGFEEI